MDQIRTIEKQRIVRTLGRLSNREVKEVKTVMKEAFIDWLKETMGNNADALWRVTVWRWVF